MAISPAEDPRRATSLEYGWPIALFVLTPAMDRDAFAGKVRRRRPLPPTPCLGGIVPVAREGTGPEVRAAARRLLDAGPPPSSDDEAAE